MMTACVIHSCASEVVLRVSFLCKLARSALNVARKLMLAAALMSAGGLYAQPFTLWVTETSPGGSPPYLDRQSGSVRSYLFDGHGYATSDFVRGPTIPAGSLSDPADVTLGPSGALYISNRNFGDDSNQRRGSVSKVGLSGNVPHAPQLAITNLDVGPSQIAFTPKGDLIATSFSSGTKLYSGITTPATVSYPTGFSRGASVRGNLLYSTSASDTVQTFDVTTGALESSFVLTGSHLLHFITPHHGALYIADIGSNTNAGDGAGGAVYKVSLAANGMPISSSKLLDLDGAISVAFSAKGEEMFVATHFTGLVEGFAVGPGDTVASTPNLVIDGGILGSWSGAHVSFGGMEITAVPEPATYVLMLAALCAIVARFRTLRTNSQMTKRLSALKANIHAAV
jgi:hypothetical protein